MKKELREKDQRPSCPYCEEEIISAKYPFCKPCEVSLRYCTKCQIAVAREETICPQCGGELEWR